MNDDTKDYFKKIGRKGGRATKKNHGPDYYKRIGKLGGRPRSSIIKK